MNRKSRDILNKLKELKPRFRNMDVKRMRVFGSVARGVATPDSDVDLIVEFYKIPGLLKYADIQNRLEDMLDCKVDLLMEDELHPALKKNILEEARDV